VWLTPLPHFETKALPRPHQYRAAYSNLSFSRIAPASSRSRRSPIAASTRSLCSCMKDPSALSAPASKSSRSTRVSFPSRRFRPKPGSWSQLLDEVPHDSDSVGGMRQQRSRDSFPLENQRSVLVPEKAHVRCNPRVPFVRLLIAPFQQHGLWNPVKCRLIFEAEWAFYAAASLCRTMGKDYLESRARLCG
jgi:hypothetical protein